MKLVWNSLKLITLLMNSNINNNPILKEKTLVVEVSFYDESITNNK